MLSPFFMQWVVDSVLVSADRDLLVTLGRGFGLLVLILIPAGIHYWALFNVDGGFYAINDVCGHRGGPLGEGELDGKTVICPWHGWRWDVTTGANVNNPAVKIVYAGTRDATEALAKDMALPMFVQSVSVEGAGFLDPDRRRTGPEKTGILRRVSRRR